MKRRIFLKNSAALGASVDTVAWAGAALVATLGESLGVTAAFGIFIGVAAKAAKAWWAATAAWEDRAWAANAVACGAAMAGGGWAHTAFNCAGARGAEAHTGPTEQRDGGRRDHDAVGGRREAEALAVQRHHRNDGADADEEDQLCNQ